MTKQLIVVVHGVGVREAGVATQRLSAGLVEGQQGGTAPWVLKSSDDLTLFENAVYNKGTLRKPFDAHKRRLERTNGETTDHRIIADFYWGDISGTGSSVLRVIVGFFKVILGLAHAVRENARSVFPGTSKSDNRFRWLAETAALTIHGPIFAINIMLLLGFGFSVLPTLLATLDSEVTVTFSDTQILLAVIAASLALGVGLFVKGSVFLTRHLGGWLILCALLLFFSGLASRQDWDGSGVIHWMDETAKQLNCAWAKELAEACKAGFTGLFVHAMRLTSLMILCWFFVLVAALVLGAVAVYRVFDIPRKRPQLIATETLALMSVLWIIVLGSVWGTVLRGLTVERPFHEATIDFGTPVGMTAVLVTSVLRALAPAIFILVLVVLVTSLMFLAHRGALRNLRSPAYYLNNDPDNSAEQGRLIVSQWSMRVLAAFFPVMLVVIVASFAAAFSDGYWARRVLSSVSIAGVTETRDGLITWTGPVLKILAGMVALALTLGGRSLSRGINIATDILTYINDYSWNSDRVETTAAEDRDTPMFTATRTFLERGFGLRTTPVPKNQPRGYWLRRRIQNRLSLLVERLIAAERPDQLVIVAHSQGTVIALDVIAAKGAKWRLMLNTPDARLDLVTMGSPYTHVYNHFFPVSFPAHRARTQLLPVASGGNLNSWTNIFRVDDFVGTHIDAVRNYVPVTGKPQFQWPEEKPVAVNGHTDYWTDKNVYPLVQEKLDF